MRVGPDGRLLKLDGNSWKLYARLLATKLHMIFMDASLL